MKRLLIGVVALPFFAGAAVAAQPLTSQQMDRITAGFSATAISDAEGLAGAESEVLTATAALAAESLYGTVSAGDGETVLSIYKVESGSQSSVAVSGTGTVTLPGVNPGR
jgi:hypothetical protein